MPKDDHRGAARYVPPEFATGRPVDLLCGALWEERTEVQSIEREEKQVP